MGNKSIGLCLSGGGHRASIFSLGALLYLVDANRHCDIEAISSVSGGALTSGFFAVQPKPLHLMDRTEFDISAASWARQIAGSPAWWYGAFAIHALLFLLWVVFVCVNWGWFPWLAQPTTLRLGGLFRSVTSLHSLCAPDSSDTGRAHFGVGGEHGSMLASLVPHCSLWPSSGGPPAMGMAPTIIHVSCLCFKLAIVSFGSCISLYCLRRSGTA
jgi:hypothetical protein